MNVFDNVISHLESVIFNADTVVLKLYKDRDTEAFAELMFSTTQIVDRLRSKENPYVLLMEFNKNVLRFLEIIGKYDHIPEGSKYEVLLALNKATVVFMNYGLDKRIPNV